MIENYHLEKWVWTEKDFDQMGWHDATIRALAFLAETYELALDIDYIFDWISPTVAETYFNFWVAPATLVFENVSDLSIDIEVFDNVQLQDILREDSREPQNAKYIEREVEWKWTCDSNVGEINFWSIGYKQFIRQTPILSRNQILSLQERGGFSFTREETSLTEPRL